jgi:hypothetical protein
MTAKEEGKPGGGCSPCCSNGGAPDLSPVLKSVKPLYGPERMRPMAGMVWYGMVWYDMVWYGMIWYGMVWYIMYTTADKSNGQTDVQAREMRSVEGLVEWLTCS